MDRVNGTNTVDIGGGRRGFRKQNKLAGISGTELTPAFFNGVQEEIMSVLTAASIAPSDASWTQLRDAIGVLITNALPVFTTPSLFDSSALIPNTAWVQGELAALPSMAGARGLKVEVTSATQVRVTAEMLTLETAAGRGLRVANFDQTANIATAGVGGLATGAEAANTWYAVWAWIKWDGTRTLTLDPSGTAPTAPAAGYVARLRCGWVRNDASSNLLRTLQYGRRARVVIGTNPTTSLVMASGSTSGAWAAVAWANYAPPTAAAIAVQLASNAQFAGSGGQYIMAAPNGSYGADPITTPHAPIRATLVTSSTGNMPAANGDLLIESANIYWLSGVSGSRIICDGWEDNL